VLFLLATEQRVVRGRPKGSWTSSQYRWAPMDAWLVDGVPSMPAPEARAALVRRWLAAFGPATTTDVKWWTGWTVAQTKARWRPSGGRGGARGRNGLGADDVASVRSPSRGLRSTGPRSDDDGLEGRSWYLGDHGDLLFDRNGSAGRRCGGRTGGRRLGARRRQSGTGCSRTSAAPTTAVARAAVALQTWLGNTRVTPRFPTPLQKQLAG
jgi:hypothetical protein